MFGPRSPGGHWFRLGRINVTSTLLVVFIGLAGMLASAISRSFFMATYLAPAGELNGRPWHLVGQLWRLFTWPLANSVSLWTLLAFVMLWYFGTFLEQQLGRNKMMRLYLEIWAALTAATFLVGLTMPGSTLLQGLGQIEFVILLLWIAEYPTRKFFFGIPAWALGAFFVGLSVLQMLAVGWWGGIASMFLGFFLVAIAARRLGLLSTYHWLPGGGTRKRAPSGRRRRSRAKEKPVPHRHVSDEQRMDELLAKISAEGLHSLTKRERTELEKLGQRRRRR